MFQLALFFRGDGNLTLAELDKVLAEVDRRGAPGVPDLALEGRPQHAGRCLLRTGRIHERLRWPVKRHPERNDALAQGMQGSLEHREEPRRLSTRLALVAEPAVAEHEAVGDVAGQRPLEPVE